MGFVDNHFVCHLFQAEAVCISHRYNSDLDLVVTAFSFYVPNRYDRRHIYMY